MGIDQELAGKRILYVITKSNWGGAQAYVFALATYFHQEGAHVAVAFGGTGTAGSETGVLAERLTNAGIKVIPLAALARDISLIRELRALKELFTLIRKDRPDVLHLNSSKAGVLGALAGRLAGVPHIVFTAHGWPHREPLGLPSRAVRWIGSWLTVLFAHRIIAVSDCDLRTAPVLFSRRKISVIHNGIAPFSVLPRVAARKELIARAPGLLDTVPWLVMLAELHRNKGIDTAIEALAQLAAFPTAALIVLGEGSERAALVQLAKERGVADRVFLLGFIPDARQYLSSADVFLMPSRKEGFPMAILEAGQAGLPVVASRVGGIPEIITREENGLLIPPQDPSALTHALATLLIDRTHAKAYGTRLQETVRTDFSEAQMLAKTARTYAA